MTQHNATEAILKTHVHCSLSSLASTCDLKARIKARYSFHNMLGHVPSYMVEHTQPANAMLAEDGLNLCTAQETVFSPFYRQQC